MKWLIAVLLAGIMFCVSAGSPIAALEAMEWTNISKLDSVPGPLKIALISVGQTDSSGEVIITPEGKRIGKVSDDEIMLNNSREAISVIYIGLKNSTAYVAIFTPYCVLIFNDLPIETKKSLRCRYMMQVIDLTRKWDATYFIR